MESLQHFYGRLVGDDVDTQKSLALKEILDPNAGLSHAMVDIVQHGQYNATLRDLLPRRQHS